MTKSRITTLLAGAGVLLFLLGLYSIRPFKIFHGPLMAIWIHPIALLLPLALGGLVALPFLLRVRRARLRVAEALKADEATKSDPTNPDRYYRSSYDKIGGAELPSRYLVRALVAFLVVFLVTLIPAGCVSNKKLMTETFDHYSFAEIKQLPEGGAVRIMPKAVADQLAVQSGNTSGYTNTNGHIVLDAKTDKLVWSYEEAPSTMWNKLTRESQGLALISAEKTDRNIRQLREDFKFAPGMHISQNIRWQILKRHYFSQPTEAVGVITSTGEPLFIAKYIVYKGFPFRHPEVGGVMVFHADGKIEDLSVEEAAKRDEIVAAGRIVPEKLARQIQESYAYKNGAWNTLFGHRDQTKIADPENSANKMPYLMAFREGGRTITKWVSIAEPHGKANATNAIFLTDSLTGKTEVWRTGSEDTLTGANRSIATAKQVSSILWSNFYAAEPRPVFIKGKLLYMLSVVPATEGASNVSKTLFVDAASNKVVAVFNHDTDPTADDEVQRYMTTGEISSENRYPYRAESNPATPGKPGDPSGGSVAEIVEQLLADNAAMKAKLEALKAQVAQDQGGVPAP